MLDRDEEIAELKRRLQELESAAPAIGNLVTPAQSQRPKSAKKVPIPLIIAGGLFAFLVVASVINKPPVQTGTNVDPSTFTPSHGPAIVTPATVSTSDPSTPDLPDDPWSYSSSDDAMRDVADKSGCVSSTKTVYLEAPYEAQDPTLCIRKSSRFGLQAVLTLPSGGQFICHSYSGCAVTVRFDDGKVQTFSGGEAADGSSDVLFIVNASRFISALKAAKVVRIEATFYQAGVQQMEFPTSTFDPAKVGLSSHEQR